MSVVRGPPHSLMPPFRVCWVDVLQQEWMASVSNAHMPSPVMYLTSFGSLHAMERLWEETGPTVCCPAQYSWDSRVETLILRRRVSLRSIMYM